VECGFGWTRNVKQGADEVLLRYPWWIGMLGRGTEDRNSVFRTGSLRTRLLELQIDRAVVRWRRLEERNFTAMMEKVDWNYQSDGLYLFVCEKSVAVQ